MVVLVAAYDGAVEYLSPINFTPTIKYMWKLNSIPKIPDNYNILATDVDYIAQYSVVLPRRGLSLQIIRLFSVWDTSVVAESKDSHVKT